MGYRTIVILYNDHAHEWSKDPLLGQKIHEGMHNLQESESKLRYMGRVVECAHADTQTLAVFDSYRMVPITHAFWRSNEKDEDMQVRILKEAAEKLGYTLRKKPSKPGTTHALHLK